MEHERFSTSGLYSVPEMGVYGGWAAHENGTKRGEHIFANETGDVALLLSGECFADRETRRRLREKGHGFAHGMSDWVVHSYEERGEGAFADLNGLFSGLLIDKRRGRAFLFNDRYGLDRIYWTETKDGVYFASEAKALLRICPELRTFDMDGVADFLAFGCTLEWRTLFRGVNVLPGGSLWSFERCRCTERRTFARSGWESLQPLTVEAFEAALEETLQRVLPLYFESESLVAVALTGGLDTRLIMALRPKDGPRPVSYTFAGANGDTLDATLGANVATLCGVDHEVIRLGPDFLADFESHADKTVYVSDGSFGVTGAHEIYLNARARRLAPVRLTGLFGSEVLRGVCTLKPSGLCTDIIDRAFHGPIAALTRHPAFCGGGDVGAAVFRDIPWTSFGPVTACRSQVTFRTPYLDNQLVAVAFQRPASLRDSLHSGLRLVRHHHPALGRLPTDRQYGRAVRVLAETTFKLDYLSNEGFPHWLSRLDPLLDRLHASRTVLGHHKFLRYRRWFRTSLATYLRDRLAAAKESSIWNRNMLDRAAADHIDGRQNYVQEIDAVLTLEAVDRLLIRSRSASEPAVPPETRGMREQTHIGA
jgi:asparagine synthase (glutamine-hydrolysing)